MKMRSGGISNRPSHNPTLKKINKSECPLEGNLCMYFIQEYLLHLILKGLEIYEGSLLKKNQNNCTKIATQKTKSFISTPVHYHKYFEFSARKKIQCSTGVSTYLFRGCFHRSITSKLTETYPKIIHLQNRRTYCITDHIFKAKLFLTTTNSHISRSTIDRHQIVNYFKTCRCSLVEASFYQIKELLSFLKLLKIYSQLPEIPSDLDYHIPYFSPGFFSLFINHHKLSLD